MSTGLGFFPYEAMNYKAAQGCLDRRARQGWELVHVYLGCIARFRRAEKPSHFVDLDNRTDCSDTDPGYLQLCADAGWELVQNVRGMLLFRAAEGASPAPIQTDSGMEWERFWKKYRPRVWHILLLLAAIALVVWARSLPSTENLAAAPASLYILIQAPLWLCIVVYIILYLGHSWWYLARCRRSGQVEKPGAIATVVDSLNRLYLPLFCACALLGFLSQTNLGKTVGLSLSPLSGEDTATVETCREWPVVVSVDLGLPGDGFSRYLDGFRSPLMEYLDYDEITHDSEGVSHCLTTERYDCVNEGLAKWAINLRRDETRKGKFIWGELGWEKVETGPGLVFDECYAARDGSYLLFRQGKVVALVGCTELDLTTQQSVDAIRARILDEGV